MKELSDILQAYVPLTEAALATVMKVEGSAYRRPGARMLITGDGRIVGGVSGGCLERDVIQRAGGVISSASPVLVRYDTSHDPGSGTGYSLGCGGAIDILIEPLNTQAGEQMMRWLDASQSNQIVIATVLSKRHPTIRLGQRMYLDHTGHVQDDIGCDEIVQLALNADRSQFFQVEFLGENIEVFLEVLHPPLKLVIFGAGNDSVPLVGFARALGWKVSVVDVGSSPLNLSRNDQADHIIRCRIDEVSRQVSIDESTAVVVMTHNFNHDSKLIRWLANQPLQYIGLLGPRHRTDLMLEEIEITDLHSPVGLDLGADNPEEVALAIVAEITAVMRGRSGGKLSVSSGPIHVHSHLIKETACPIAAS